MAYFTRNKNSSDQRLTNISSNGRTLNAQLYLSDNTQKQFAMRTRFSKVTDNVFEVDNNDAFITLHEFATDAITSSKLQAPKAFCIYNTGVTSLEVQFAIRTWANSSENDGSVTYVSQIINPGDFFYSPTGRIINYDNDTSGANAATLDNVLPSDTTTNTFDGGGSTNDGPFYMDTGVDIGGSHGAGVTALTFDSTLGLRPGDILGLDSGGGTTIDEYIKVLSITDATTAECQRGFYGTTAQSLSTSTDVHYYFHNEGYNLGTEDDSKTRIRTDASGNFVCNNFFGYGRSITATPPGIVPGSVAIKFYPAAHQMLNLSGITTSSDTGLTGGTTYEFRITTVIGTTADIAFTVDSSNTKWGGVNGVLQKINAAFQASTSLDMYRASIFQGDIKFEDRRGLKGNFVTLAAPSDGTSLWGVGNVPATGSHGKKIVVELPSDTIIDKETGKTMPNVSVFMTDDGKGNLKGAGTGTINYDTGRIEFIGPYRSEFVINASYASALGGKMNTATNYINIIEGISARSTNSKVNSSARVIVYT